MFNIYMQLKGDLEKFENVRSKTRIKDKEYTKITFYLGFKCKNTKIFFIQFTK